MKKATQFRKIITSALIAGLATGAPVAASFSMPVMAAEEDSIELNLKQSEGGVISSNAANYIQKGETITLDAVADEGYRFSHWILTSDGHHELVSGAESDPSISVRVNASGSGRLFKATAVFVENDKHAIMKDGSIFTFAKTGETVDVSNMFESTRFEDDNTFYSYLSSVDVYRLSDYENVTDEVSYNESHTFIMPDYDIALGTFHSALLGDKILEDFGEDENENTFTIENATGGIAQLPESANAGDMVEIVTLVPDMVGTYRIERVSDGMDVTDFLLPEQSTLAFFMPFYDIKISKYAVKAPSIPSANALNNISEENSEEFKETILADFRLSPEAESNDNDFSANVNSSEDETQPEDNSLSVNETTPEDVSSPIIEAESETAAGSTVKITPENTTEETEEEISAITGANAVKTAVVKDSKAVASPLVSRISQNEIVSSEAQGAEAVQIHAPAAIRAEGASSASAKTITAPPTGDYNITGALTFTAIAAAAGLATAAVMLKRKSER